MKDNTHDKTKEGVLDEFELRNRGKTDSVIDVLRNLPYLEQEFYGDRWTMMHYTRHVNYAIGQTYSAYLENDDILPLPAHIIWLTEGFERAGVYLLLDTHTWEIIEYTLLGESIQAPYEEYEALPVEERYTAYTKMPADYYMDLWKWRHVTLNFMLIRASSHGSVTGEWFDKDPRLIWEEGLVPSDDDEAEDEDWMPDVDEEDGGDDNDDDMKNIEDIEIDNGKEGELLNELEELSLADLSAPAQDQQTQQEDNGTVLNKSMLFAIASASKADFYRKSPQFENGEDVKRLIAIYHAHGWPIVQHEYRTTGRYEVLSSSLAPASGPPKEYVIDLSNFDREGCFTAVAEWHTAHHERQRAKLDANMKSEKHKIILTIRHKLQKLLLAHRGKPNEDHVTVDEEGAQEASRLMMELFEWEPDCEAILKETKIHKVLQAIVANEALYESKGRRDLVEVCGSARGFLEEWQREFPTVVSG